MTQPSTIAQRFLSKPRQLGIVAVGFNGGQVCCASVADHMTIHEKQKQKKLTR